MPTTEHPTIHIPVPHKEMTMPPTKPDVPGCVCCRACIGTTTPRHSGVAGAGPVLQRNDGRVFLVYHTRFAYCFHPGDDGDFDMRVREQVMTDNGWLAASPAPYRGEPMQPVGMADIPGDYDIVIHDPTTCFTGDTDDAGRREGRGCPCGRERTTRTPSRMRQRISGWSG